MIDWSAEIPHLEGGCLKRATLAQGSFSFLECNLIRKFPNKLETVGRVPFLFMFYSFL